MTTASLASCWISVGRSGVHSTHLRSANIFKYYWRWDESEISLHICGWMYSMSWLFNSFNHIYFSCLLKQGSGCILLLHIILHLKRRLDNRIHLSSLSHLQKIASCSDRHLLLDWLWHQFTYIFIGERPSVKHSTLLCSNGIFIHDLFTWILKFRGKHLTPRLVMHAPWVEIWGWGRLHDGQEKTNFLLQHSWNSCLWLFRC